MRREVLVRTRLWCGRNLVFLFVIQSHSGTTRRGWREYSALGAVRTRRSASIPFGPCGSVPGGSRSCVTDSLYRDGIVVERPERYPSKPPFRVRRSRFPCIPWWKQEDRRRIDHGRHGNALRATREEAGEKGVSHISATLPPHVLGHGGFRFGTVHSPERDVVGCTF